MNNWNRPNKVTSAETQEKHTSRRHRTLNDKAESMRQQACLPNSWWEFCVLHGNYVYNRTPMRRLDWITPSESLFKEKPNLQHLRIIGCGAYVFIPKEVRKNKLSPKSELMIFLGYRGHHTNMIFMRSPNNVIFTATTALFDEKMFPKCVTEKVPPVTQIQEPTEEPVVEIDLGDDHSDAEPPNPPPIIIPQGVDERTHDDDVPPQPPIPQEPRRSTRDRTKPTKEGNVYPPGTSTDSDLRKRLPQIGILGSTPDFAYGSSNTEDDDPAIAKMAVEGGVSWYTYLLGKAIPYDDGFPDPMYVRDWTTKDIGKLPADQQQEWHKAQFEELEALKKRNVYELTDLPPGRKAIKNRWVFDIKSDGRQKARLVAKGFSQLEGLDYDEIFSPVVRFESVRTILALATLEKWGITALDVKSAFLYGRIDEEIYMEQPHGFVSKEQPHKVLRLLMASNKLHTHGGKNLIDL